MLRASEILLAVVTLTACNSVGAAAPPIDLADNNSITETVTVQGLEGADVGVVRLSRDTADGSAPVLLDEIFGNGEYDLVLTVPDGIYKLVIDAPPAYFHEPKGYSFQVFGGKILNYTGRSFDFTLIPPSAQYLPPCRGLLFEASGGTNQAGAEADEPVCQAEATIGLSAPLKQPIPTRPIIAGSFSGMSNPDALVTLCVHTTTGWQKLYGSAPGKGPWEILIYNPAEIESYTLTAEAEGYISGPASYTFLTRGETAYLVRNGEIAEEAMGLDFEFTPIDSSMQTQEFKCKLP